VAGFDPASSAHLPWIIRWGVLDQRGLLIGISTMIIEDALNAVME
jgi:hypothetical protein